jgi:Fe-S-cluster containining protein
LADYLTPAELTHYLSLVGEDGWCVHYEQATRRCRIYADRPDFCRVQADTFERMFGIAAEELNDFAIACCEAQIDGVYGSPSEELTRFQRAVGQSD